MYITHYVYVFILTYFIFRYGEIIESKYVNEVVVQLKKN